MDTTNDTTPRKVPVTERALVQRLKRHCARHGLAFYVTRGRARRDLGAYHSVDADNRLARRWDDLGELVSTAREVGCLKPHEEVAS
jgi:hypothetical protein